MCVNLTVAWIASNFSTSEQIVCIHTFRNRIWLWCFCFISALHWKCAWVSACVSHCWWSLLSTSLINLSGELNSLHWSIPAFMSAGNPSCVCGQDVDLSHPSASLSFRGGVRPMQIRAGDRKTHFCETATVCKSRGQHEVGAFRETAQQDI